MRSVELRLRDIAAAIDNIQRHVPVTRSAFDSNELIQVWIVHHCAIIGEACAAIPDDFRSAHPEVPWPSIIGMRNKLVHHYFGIDKDVVWNTVVADLPALKQQVANVLDGLLRDNHSPGPTIRPEPSQGGDRDE